MNWYDRLVLPYLLDVACGLPMVQNQRRQLVPKAQGRVLEVGMGTGRNLPFYDRSRVSQLVGVDPAMQMHRLARKRSQQAGIAVELMGLSAAPPTKACAAGKTVCSRCGGHWPVVASSGVIFPHCWTLQALRPARNRPIWLARAR